MPAVPIQIPFVMLKITTGACWCVEPPGDYVGPCRVGRGINTKAFFGAANDHWIIMSLRKPNCFVRTHITFSFFSRCGSQGTTLRLRDRLDRKRRQHLPL